MKKLSSFRHKKERKILNSIYKKVFMNLKLKTNIVDHFHRLYYESKYETWKNTFWLGLPTQKCPLDLWIYQEIIFESKPDIIIETGTADGGSALFLASICDLLNKGEIISIDIEHKKDRPNHIRIVYLLGSSTSNEITEKVQSFIRGKDKILVILDSDHSKQHVFEELEIYSKLVTKGSYIIVEDTNVNGHPVDSDFGPGPMETVKEFIEKNEIFVIDKSREKFYLPFNPNGYMKRIK